MFDHVVDRGGEHPDDKQDKGDRGDDHGYHGAYHEIHHPGKAQYQFVLGIAVLVGEELGVEGNQVCVPVRRMNVGEFAVGQNAVLVTDVDVVVREDFIDDAGEYLRIDALLDGGHVADHPGLGAEDVPQDVFFVPTVLYGIVRVGGSSFGVEGNGGYLAEVVLDLQRILPGTDQFVQRDGEGLLQNVLTDAEGFVAAGDGTDVVGRGLPVGGRDEVLQPGKARKEVFAFFLLEFVGDLVDGARGVFLEFDGAFGDHRRDPVDLDTHQSQQRDEHQNDDQDKFVFFPPHNIQKYPRRGIFGINVLLN